MFLPSFSKTFEAFALPLQRERGKRHAAYKTPTAGEVPLPLWAGIFEKGPRTLEQETILYYEMAPFKSHSQIHSLGMACVT